MGYCAFISYKHEAADMKVAVEIQKKIERYHIPSQIKQNTGKKTMGQVFRDETEIPVSGVLYPHIQEALDNSEFLIVICSKKTKDSHWIPREIEWFLRNHGKDHILTVLVDGKPEEVIPDILCRRNNLSEGEEGTLSCDLRKSSHKSRGTEILRLMSALLGCTLDDLVMRQKQYRRRQLMAASGLLFAVMSIAMGYLFWSRNKIQQNLQEALINQSMYLSTESRNLLKKGNRIRAIELAELAMPHDNDRPLVPEAQSALTSALHAYSVPETEEYYNVYDTVAELDTKGEIEDFFASDDSRYICARDHYGMVYIWDAFSGDELLRLWGRKEDEEISTENAETTPADIRETSHSDVLHFIGDIKGEIKDICFLCAEDAIAVLTESGIEAFRIAEGNLLWKYEKDEVKWQDAIMLPRGDGRIYIAAPYGKRGDLFSIPEAGIEVFVLDAEGGEELFVNKQAIAYDVFIDLPSLQFATAESGDLLALSVFGEYDDQEQRQVIVYDIKSGDNTMIQYPSEYGNVAGLYFLDDTHLGIMASPIDALERTYINETERHFAVYDLKTGDYIWKNYQESRLMLDLNLDNNYSFRNIKDFGSMKGINEEGKIDVFLFNIFRNKFYLFKANTGDLYDVVEFEGNIVNWYQLNNSSLNLILDNGYVCKYSFRKRDAIIPIKYFGFDNMGAWKLSGEGSPRFLLKQDDNTLLISDIVYDRSYKYFQAETLSTNSSPDAIDTIGDCLMLFYDEGGYVYLYDLSDESAVRKIVMGEQTKCTYLGKDEEKSSIWFLDDSFDSAQSFICINLKDGSISRFVLSEGHGNRYTGSSAYFENGSFYLYSYNCLETAALEDNILKPLNYQDSDNWIEKCFFNTSAAEALFTEKGIPGVTLINLESGEKIHSDISLREKIQDVVWHQSGKYIAIADTQRVVIVDNKGKQIWGTEDVRQPLESFCIHDDVLILLYSDGKLIRYSIPTGEIIGRTSVSPRSREKNWCKSEWVFKNNLLLIHSRDWHDYFRIIELDTWKEIAAIPYVYAFDAERDRLICHGTDRSTNEIHLGYYPVYTPDDLIEMADMITRGGTLNEEDKALYGIE